MFIQASERARIVYPNHEASVQQRILKEVQRSGNLNPDALAAALLLPPAVVRQTLLNILGAGEGSLNKVGNVDSKVDALQFKVDTVERSILEKLKGNSTLTQELLARELQVPLWKVKQATSRMVQAGILAREGGKQQGVLESAALTLITPHTPAWRRG